MEKDRAIELLNAVINHMFVAENSFNVISELLSIGFTRDELVNDFGLCESDVDDVLEEREE